MGATVSSISDITLVTLQNCSASMEDITRVLKSISDGGVNIDMISLAPTHGSLTDFSFTIDDNDLFTCISELRSSTDAKFIVSNGNYKISVYDTEMKNTPGVAYKVLNAAAAVHADIRLISTSEVEISLLVTSADYERTLEAVGRVMEN